MPQPKKGYSLGATPSHQRLMLKNLTRSLFENERVTTTEAKAKTLRPFAEKLITKAKKGSIHHRRQALALIEDREVVHKLFADIGPRFSTRNGGYTRILKLGRRNGDGAAMALVELVSPGAQSAAAGPLEQTSGRRLRRPGRRRSSPAGGSTTEAPPAPSEGSRTQAGQAEEQAPLEDERPAPEAEADQGEQDPEQ